MNDALKTDWVEWHRPYDDPTSSQARRLIVVQRELRRALDSHPGAIRLISMCAGQGRDVLPVLSTHAKRDEIDALLVELDPHNVESAERTASDLGLDRVRVRQGDAGLSDTYADATPADIVLACGVFGNIDDADVYRTIENLPFLCAAGATVLWTRGRQSHRDFAQDIRPAFKSNGFEEIAFEAPDDAKYRVGACRLVAAPRAFEHAINLFRFTL